MNSLIASIITAEKYNKIVNDRENSDFLRMLNTNLTNIKENLENGNCRFNFKYPFHYNSKLKIEIEHILEEKGFKLNYLHNENYNHFEYKGNGKFDVY